MREPDRPGRGLTRAALMIGILAILLSLGVACAAFVVRRNHVRQEMLNHHLDLARVLAAQVRLTNTDALTPERLDRLRLLWNAVQSKPPGSSLLVVRGDGTVCLDTAQPERAGQPVGRWRVGSGASECLHDLIAAGEDRAGRVVSPAGEEQLAAFVSVPDGDGWIAVQAPLQAVNARIHADFLPWEIAFAVIIGVLLPVALGFSYRAYAAAQAAQLRGLDLLRNSEERCRRLVEICPDAIFINKNERIVFTNPACLKLFGAASPDQVCGRSPFDFIHPDYHAAVRERIRRLREERETVPFLEEKIIRLDGSLVDVEVTACPFPDPDGEAILVLLHDVARRKQTMRQLAASLEQLKALAGYLQSVREQERTQIAREIHDELGQALTGLKMDLSWLKGRLVKETDAAGTAPLLERLQAMRGLIDHTIQTVRRIATELRPGVLDDFGLVAAIEWQAHEFQNRSGITCTVETALESVELDRDRSTAVFRILQETLTNVARHAHARAVAIRLQKDGDFLKLEVEDNGIGITDEALSRPRSLGLLGMRERAALTGGDLQIEGSPGKGTRLTLRVPLGTG